MADLLRTINVTIPVYAAIWADRQDGENSEDDILRRRFNLAKSAGASQTPERDMAVTVGYYDERFGVRIDSGFTIHRTYKGVQYSAQALQGFWVLNTTAKGYPTLHQLNQAVREGNENAWNVWWYKDKDGRRFPVSNLRDKTKIIRRA